MEIEEEPVPSAGTPEPEQQPVRVKRARTGGRQRMYTDEERKERARASRIKYEAKRGEALKIEKRARARAFEANYRDASLPLVESREIPGKFICTVCSSIIASQYKFGLHAQSKKHTAALEAAEALS